jgi:hypothetical protein
MSGYLKVLTLVGLHDVSCCCKQKGIDTRCRRVMQLMVMLTRDWSIGARRRDWGGEIRGEFGGEDSRSGRGQAIILNE